MKQMRTLAALFGALIVMTACASMTAPETPDQAVYAAYGTYVAVGNTAADYAESGLISRETAIAVQDRMQEVRPVIMGAKQTVRNGGTPTANTLAAVRAAQNALLEVQARMVRQRKEQASE